MARGLVGPTAAQSSQMLSQLGQPLVGPGADTRAVANRHPIRLCLTAEMKVEIGYALHLRHQCSVGVISEVDVDGGITALVVCEQNSAGIVLCCDRGQAQIAEHLLSAKLVLFPPIW